MPDDPIVATIRAALRGADFECAVYRGLVTPEHPIGARPFFDADFYFADEPGEAFGSREFAPASTTWRACRLVVDLMTENGFSIGREVTAHAQGD